MIYLKKNNRTTRMVDTEKSNLRDARKFVIHVDEIVEF